MSEISALTYSSWGQFKADLIPDLFRREEFQRSRFLFRGQMDSNWKLESSFDRWFSALNSNLERIQVADQLLAVFKDECERLQIEETIRTNDVSLLALGQHFGLPTRLLDWTDSPYTAAFFAFSDHISSGAPPGAICLWALDRNHPIWTKEMGVEVVNVSYYGNLRLRNQMGSFTLSRTPFSCLEDYVSNCRDSGTPLHKIILSTDLAKTALADLDLMGINHSRIFPEILGCALASKMRVLLQS